MGITPYAKNASGLKHAVGRKGAHLADGRTVCFMTRIRICFCAAGALVKSMLEKEVEQYLCKKVKKELQGWALKFVSPGLNGVPDRIVLVPMGRIYFVELKAPGKKLRKLQEYVCGLIKQLGFKVLRIDTKEKVDAFVREVQKNG